MSHRCAKSRSQSLKAKCFFAVNRRDFGGYTRCNYDFSILFIYTKVHISNRYLVIHPNFCFRQSGFQLFEKREYDLRSYLPVLKALEVLFEIVLAWHTTRQKLFHFIFQKFISFIIFVSIKTLMICFPRPVLFGKFLIRGKKSQFTCKCKFSYKNVHTM